MSSTVTSKRPANTFVEEYDHEKRSRTTEDTDDSRSSTVDDQEERTLKMAAAIKTVLECLGEDVDREGLERTPMRAAKALQFLTSGYSLTASDVIGEGVFNEETKSDMVVVRNIDINSLCEHHMLPFTGKVHIAYIPQGKILGLSKLARISNLFSRRLQVQERLTRQIAEAIMSSISPLGVGVMIEASHMCMVMRGVEKSGSSTVTSSLLGTFESDKQTRAEFFNLMNSNNAQVTFANDPSVVLKLKSFLNSIASGLLETNSVINEKESSTDSMLQRFSFSPEFTLLYLFLNQTDENHVIISIDGTSPLLLYDGQIVVVSKASEAPLTVDRPLSSQLQVVTVTGDGTNGDKRILNSLQQCTRHFYQPLIRAAAGHASNASGGGPKGDSETDNMVLLQKKVRELDIILEQCQRGALIPSAQLIVHPTIVEAAQKVNVITLRGHLEKYNVSQVDQFLIDAGLNAAMGSSAESKEEFANELNKSAKLWPIEIAKQTKLLESAFPGAIDKEISFWRELEKKLAETKEVLESGPVALTKLILRRTNRVSEQLIRESELSLEKSQEVVQVSVTFLRDFPIDDIEAATDLHPRLNKAANACLLHFGKLRHSKYDFNRALQLLEVLCTTITARMINLLKEKAILLCDIEELRQLKRQSDEIFVTVESQVATQRSMLKDVAKRRNEKMRALNFNYESLQQRLAAIYEFRENHQRLVTVFTSVLTGQESDLLSELGEAFRLLLRVEGELFDLSPSGTSSWISAQDMYERRLERVEARITRLLEGRLTHCKSAEDMFRVFATFNPLFFRPAIRNAVNSFRSSLVRNVREDVHRLQNKFKLRYDDSLERITADLRDIPPLSGQIIWARQIENQLSTLMQRMEDVLGRDWGDHFEGKQLKEVCDELRSYLTTDQLYNEWLSIHLSKSDTGRFTRVKDFLLLVESDTKTQHRCLVVNYDEKQVTVFKEVRYLEWLLPLMNTAQKAIPHTIRANAKEAFARYPVAMALQAALTGFSQAKTGINESNSSLLVTHVLAVREMIKEAIGGTKRTKRWVKWDSPDLNDWVGQLSNKVLTLQERVTDVNDKLAIVETCLQQLAMCPYNQNSFLDLVERLQSVVDDMQTRGLSNILTWVQDLDRRVEAVVLERIKVAIKSWTNAFDCGSSVDKSAQASIEPQETPLILDQTVYEILLSNQILYLSPPLHQARMEWIAAFHQFIAVCSSLPRIAASRFHVFAKSTNLQKNYADVVQRVDAHTLRSAFHAIEEKLAEAGDYVGQWLQYQTLWDASVSDIADKLGRDIPKWSQLLIEIKAARATIETVDDEKCFGPIVINHRQVQNKVNLKYDLWQKEAQQRFGHILLEEVRNIHSELIATKSKLEAVYLDGPTKDVISGVEFILQTKSTMKACRANVTILDSSEKLLQKQRFQFPKDWVPVSNVVSALADMCQILERRSTAMDQQLPSLQAKIRDEDSTLHSRTEELSASWEKDRPIDGNATPSDVLQALSQFAALTARLSEDSARLHGAKSALGLENIQDNRLHFIGLEVADLREAWIAVTPFHEKLKSIRSVFLRDANPTQIRKQLEDNVNELRSLPAKIRSYSAVESLHDKLAKYLAIQPVLRDLSTEALKDRHWRVILQGLRIQSAYSDVTLGTIWDSNPIPHRKLIQEVLSTAQGELALEQFLRDLREHWVSCELNLTLRNSIRLVTGWELLFSTLEDNLNSLASLKQSPYFRNVPEFQEDTSSWETRLTNLRAIFDFWVEVQRKWVYLRGIFKNPDIKAQLPAQFSKFKSIDGEFTALLKRVAAKPAVLELLQMDNLARQLERQDGAMILIQKALGDYLEKQRQIFPRFYFVNNDDLVEIIGNVSEPGKILAHLGKMFSAISTLEIQSLAEATSGSTLEDSGLDGTTQTAVAMCSKEGERVPLTAPIVLTTGVKEWLAQLESGMSLTLANLLKSSLAMLPSQDTELIAWLNQYPAQVIILASQIVWTAQCESALKEEKNSGLVVGLEVVESRLRSLSSSVLNPMDAGLRKKCEQLLTEMIHQRDVSRLLVTNKVFGAQDFLWLYHLRFYNQPKETDPSKQLVICMSNASFNYGFEYLGIGERLVQTPLTDRCYLTLTQALHLRMGGNPFGPAGTGKTESVKMLGSQLGRFVLVFNCDSSFDYAAMGRIFAGLCQVGAWGCFDEFNRLEERILSAVSQQILTIQKGLIAKKESIELLGTSCKLHKDVGIFVTLNPGYAGRSNLPDNLKRLFRAVAMTVPDRKLITQVMLFSQGIVTAEELAGKIVLLFTLCEEQLSEQSHYDFGLRALKSVLTGAGDLKRQAIAVSNDDENKSLAGRSIQEVEIDVLIKATCDSILPKLVAEDIPLFTSLLKAVFPSADLPRVEDKLLLDAIHKVCEEDCLEFTTATKWAEKVLQLKQVLDMRHGVMLVGPCATGKSTAWRTLFKALANVDGSKGEFCVIDPKSIKKEKLYGSLDPNTLEWTDGVFTKTLRKVIESTTNNIRVAPKRCWIVFDGDVDPEWAENLNSVLDDNKILTLPSGDRLKIPDNVRIMMEVDTLVHATLATVSRCGMVWFAADTVSVDVALQHHLKLLKKQNILSVNSSSYGVADLNVSKLQQQTQERFLESISTHFISSPGLVSTALEFSMKQQHVMEPSMGRLLATLDSLLIQGIGTAVEYNENNSTFPMSDAHIEKFATKWLMYSLLWAFGGSLFSESRIQLADLIMDHSTHSLDTQKAGKETNLVELYVDVDGSWVEWLSKVPRVEIESHKVTSSDVVISTTDTIRHTEILRAWLASHKPLVLCGPPGSGKTMTLTSVLESMSEYILAVLNFSSSTTPELLLKTFAQYCEIVDSPDGLVMQPNHQSYRDNQWLVIFCDEINLPEPDQYGTQRVIMFMRQLVERGGYWNNDCRWISIKRIQFVGACNPPTDAGRVLLSQRFLRHAPLLLVDYPTEVSLKQIYRCFNHALLKMHPNLRGAVDPLNNAMVQVYLKNQMHFTQEVAPQYVYSPRELSRWVRAMYEAMEPLEAMTMEELVRLWAHEALRLFHDRLMTVEEKEWCEELLDEVAAEHFHGVDIRKCLQRPMLYSNWLKKTYSSTDRDDLRSFVAARLKVFYEEELDVPLVIFDDVLEHVLRIDNVLRHPMGHVLLVGESGVGKTVLSRFVSWINGLKIFQIKANNRYTIENFDEDLRGLLRRVGVDGECISFIFDESNVLSSAFLERMNALLASGEVPGLFEGDERVQLLAAMRDSANQRDSVALDADDELWRRFTRLVQRNLHVIFTMNPASSDFQNRCTASPALFNRCVVDWFGTWSPTALAQVGREFTANLDTGFTTYSVPQKSINASSHIRHGETTCMELLYMVADLSSTGSSSQRGANKGVSPSDLVTPDLRCATVAALVSIHDSVKEVAGRMAKVTGRQHYLSPRDFLDLIRKFTRTEQEKRSLLEDQQTHIRTGLNKLLETQAQVAILRVEMVDKEKVLRVKDTEASQKLSQMVEKQNEAERQKVIAETLTHELEQQNAEIKVRKEAVEQELSEAEPALQSAKHSVQNIKRTQLDEVRALTRPPSAVILTMEMVCVMIGEKNLDWTEIRKVIRRDDFISTVVNFDPSALTSKQVKQVQDDYLSKTDIDYTIVDRASKACGPLYQWAESQIKYATILRKIKPLRDEMTQLEEQSAQLLVQQQQAVAQVQELENAIRTYKSEYATAIRDTEKIQSEMNAVSEKVSRAEALLQSLDQEKDRWQGTSASFDAQMATLIGDCLLAAAFLTYGGIFDHRLRRTLLMDWSETLDTLGIPFRPELNMVTYLSSPADQMRWKSLGLNSDELSIENAVLLERFDRYPLVVDPSGQAANYLLNKYADQRIVQTSFLDSAFLKTLASAIRFGTPLLVNDVETIDPILNPVLNKEIQRTGGRTLIRLGNEDIDFSPKFFIVLMTRNPLARFAPDLCSRVTLVNFTVTPASLEAQTISAILKAERPDVDNRRTEVLRLQGEQSVRLRELEETLLNKISAVQGAILDDDSVIRALEQTKAEAAELQGEVEKTAVVMEEVKTVSSSYEPLATAMAAVYFSLEALADVSFLYQFSLQMFLECVDKVLIPTDRTAITPTDAKATASRVKALSLSFFAEISRRSLRSLRLDDKIMFLVRLGQIMAAGQTDKELTSAEVDLLHKGSAFVFDIESKQSQIQKFKSLLPCHQFDDATSRQLLALSLVPSFSHISSILTDATTEVLDEILRGPEPEKHIPMEWLPGKSGDLSPERAALLRVLLVRALRPECTIRALEDYVSAVFGNSFDWREHCRPDLRAIVDGDSQASRPIFICSEPGHDASGQVDALSAATGRSLVQVAMGSAEGFAEADRGIAHAQKVGAWVLLRNVHLCIDWLTVLEKRLPAFSPHKDFRLFLTCEINPRLPTALVRASDVIVAEASTGLKANILRFYNNIPNSRIDKAPSERVRLYSLLCWLNAVVQERRRYTPLGWTKRYEFSEADALCALDVIDEWLEGVSGDGTGRVRAHVDPGSIPWTALRTLLSESLYGGRIDVPFDQVALNGFVNALFTVRSYGVSTVLVSDSAGAPVLTLPDSLSRQAFEDWVRALPDSNSPTWIGLPATAEGQLMRAAGQRVLNTLAVVQDASTAGGRGEVTEVSGKGEGKSRSQELESVGKSVDTWLQSLDSCPATIPLDAKRLIEAASPIERCLAREVEKGVKIVQTVRKDLMQIRSFARGAVKMTNEVRDLLRCVSRDQLPLPWRLECPVPADVTLTLFLADLVRRLNAQETYRPVLTGANEQLVTSGLRFWIGGMFAPDSFVTAIRQQAAQANEWNLEELELWADIDCTSQQSSTDIIVENVLLEGAVHGSKGLELSEVLRSTLPPCRLRWQPRTSGLDCSSNRLLLPLYRDQTRIALVSEVLVSRPVGASDDVWAQRGVALVMKSYAI